MKILVTNKCSVCGRWIWDKKSLEVGVGPVCRKKLGIKDCPKLFEIERNEEELIEAKK